MSDSLTEILIKKRTIEVNILTHLQNYRRTLKTSNDIGANVLKELSEHREKLDEVDGEIKNMKENMDKNDDHISGISSVIGIFRSFFSNHGEKSEDDEEDDIPRPSDRDTNDEKSVDSNGFRSVVNSEMRAIKKLLKNIHGATEEMYRELKDQDERIQQKRLECEELDNQAKKEIKACDDVLKEY